MSNREAKAAEVPGVGEHLLLLSENFYPTDSSGGRLLAALAEDLAAEGVQVSVLTSFSAMGGKRTRRRRESYRGIDIRRVPSLRLPRANVLGRLLNELSLTLLILFAALTARKPGRIMVTSSPPFLAPAAALVAKFRRVPLIFIVMDVYPDMAAATRHISCKSSTYRIWDSLTRFAISNSERVVVLGRCMSEVVRAKAGNRTSRLVILPNWADGKEIYPLDPEFNPFFVSHPHLKGKFIVQYSGNLGRFHDFETILGAAERLRDRDDIQFVIIGEGVKKAWLEEQVAARGLDNVGLLPFQPQSRLNQLLNAQSVSLVTLEEGTEGLCVPSKFYPILAAGKPVIAVMDRRAEVARVVEEEGVGFVVTQRDAPALARVIDRLKSSPELCSKMGRRARALQQRKFDRRQAVKHYRELLASIGTEPGRRAEKRPEGYGQVG